MSWLDAVKFCGFYKVFLAKGYVNFLFEIHIEISEAESEDRHRWGTSRQGGLRVARLHGGFFINRAEDVEV